LRQTCWSDTLSRPRAALDRVDDADTKFAIYTGICALLEVPKHIQASTRLSAMIANVTHKHVPN